MALKDVVAGKRNEEGIASALAVLKQQLGDRLQTGQAFREQHGHTTTYLTLQAPDGVVFAESADDVKAVVKVCSQYKVPVIPFGTGSSLEGQVNAPSGGICIDFSRMNRIIEVNAEDLDVTVEPGVTREDLNVYLRDTGLFFPIDPGANASIGGMASTRASGTNAVRYGTMKDNVLAVTAVVANGEEIRTARRARKSSAGYDLTRLFVGAEGTLGVITSVTLRLQGIPEKIAGGVCTFDSIKAACDAVIMTIQMGVPVARIELLDEVQVRACNAYSGLNYAEKPTLFLEFHGTEETAALQSQQFAEIAAECGSIDFRWTSDAAERNKLWKARHDAYWASRALAPHLDGLSTDVCVPISRLADCVVETQLDIQENGFLAPIVGHAGDGNFHVLILFDGKDAESVAKTEAFVARLNRRAIAMDGTCTGEHGIGQGKMSFLAEEAGNALDVMRAIKMSLDPDNIFNPGKLFRLV
ncbi:MULTISPECIES: FAD-binding oxidoreductase [Agrobacterium]|uniref:FAD-binding oxidoreductase n=1 Tax=Agrobacterium TaxID=357 RepID=UPI00027D5822|nr:MULTISPECIES: FAD-linked oxidase C-terminal domain-containing protein [Agrobacterium]AUC10125.1 FAD-binding oxidoreductase [Rhizobium sp. Y9]KIV64521.1 D-Lactate dehydrogenase, cytochrome c-dependent [Rhizobium sp. UR51a]MDP9774051.1 glycolate oxidase subunit GlcD [Rhizobium sp. SORGH_AS_0755]OAI86912.1 lactate dehydrogenase [Rhizobium sp. GHKF11]MBA8797669.1 (R,R)-butanediol dehydrogenase/meso-butanediol dehydrogenase/diacetyl reductase/D-lactate dehydrogenase (cytochrome) [Agrobacterium s